MLLLVVRTAAAADGALDDSFGNFLPGISKVAFDLGSSDTDSPTQLLVQSDGKLVLVGTGDSAAGSGTVIEMARLLPGGTLDATFGAGGRVSYAPPVTKATAYKAALQADGRIVTIGTANPAVGTNSDFLVCRFTTTGLPDATFAGDGCTTIAFDLGLNVDEGFAVAIQTDGKIVVFGIVAGPVPGAGFHFGFARLTTTGALDPAFGFGGTGKQVITRFADLAGVPTTEFSRALLIQSDGKIVGVGSTSLVSTFGSGDFAVVRLTASGILDANFGNGGVVKAAFDIGGSMDDGANAVAQQSDGKIVAAGYATFSQSDIDFAVVRLNPTGSLDSTFSGDGKATYAFDLGGAYLDEANSLVLQSNGRIVLAGRSYNGANGGAADDDITMCRVMPSGAIDTTFGTSGRVAIGLNFGGGNFDRGTSLGLQGGRIVLAAEAAVAPAGNRDFIAMRFVTDLVFTSGFE